MSDDEFKTLDDALKRFITLRDEYRIKYDNLSRMQVNQPESYLINVYDELIRVGTLLERNGIDLSDVE